MAAAPAPAPPRLLSVSSYFDTHPGGLETVAGALARELGRRGWRSTWLATDATPAPADTPHVVHRTAPASNLAERRLKVPYPAPTPRGLLHVVAAVREADAVLVHDGLYLTSVAAVLAARALRRPVVLVQHISLVPYRNPVLRWAMRAGVGLVARPVMALAGEVVFISRRVQDFFEAGAGAGRRRRPSHLVLSGVDADVFRPCAAPEDRARLRQDLGLPAEAPVALFVGRFVEKKGLDHLREAARARPDVVWLLAGWGAVEPEAWRLPNVRVVRGLSGPPLAELYRAADAFVLPSCGEGFPLVVQEALATGLPVVCGEDSAAADPDAAPLLFPIAVDAPAATAARLCTALDLALAEPPAVRQARVLYARRRYAWASAAARYAELLHGLLAARAGTVAVVGPVPTPAPKPSLSPRHAA